MIVMRKLSLIILSVLTIVLLNSCKNGQDLPSAKYEYVGVPGAKVPSTIFEGTDGVESKAVVPVYYGSDVEPGQAVTVTFTVASSSNAVIGTNVMIEGADVSGQSFTVTVPADTFATSFTIVSVPNNDQNDDINVVFDISSVSGGVNIGYPFDSNASIVILDDDCPYDFDAFLGTAAVVENGSYGPYPANMTKVATNKIATDNFWDTGATVTMTLVPCDGSVDVPLQTYDYFGTDPNGTVVSTSPGTWDDVNKVIVINIRISLPAYSFVSDEQHVFTF